MISKIKRLITPRFWWKILNGPYANPNFQSFFEVSKLYEKFKVGVMISYVSILGVGMSFLKRTLGEEGIVVYAPPPVLRAIDWLPVEVYFTLIYVTFFISTIAILIGSPKRVFKVLSFVSLVFIFAHSYGITHVRHASNCWIWLAFSFCFLPNEGLNVTRAVKMQYLSVCRFAALITLSVYTMSASWKVLEGIILASVEGEMSYLNPQSMSVLIASYITKHGYEPPLAEFVIANLWVSWPLILGTIYMQLFAMVALFRPYIISLWLIMILSFHILSIPLLNLPFNAQGIGAALVLVAFPFMRMPNSMGQIVNSLPLVAESIVLLRKLKKTS